MAIPRGEGDKDLDGECVCACERASVPVGEKATELREGEREKRGSEREGEGGRGREREGEGGRGREGEGARGREREGEGRGRERQGEGAGGGKQ